MAWLGLGVYISGPLEAEASYQEMGVAQRWSFALHDYTSVAYDCTYHILFKYIQPIFRFTTTKTVDS